MHRPADRGFISRLRAGDELALLITLAATVSILLVVGLIVFELWTRSEPAMRAFGFSFFQSSAWDPNANKFGALPFIFGTCVTSALALIIAIPTGVAASIFLAEMAPPGFSNILTFMIELLAAVPSVIYGLLGIFILVPLIHQYLAPFLIATFGWTPFFQGRFLRRQFPVRGIGAGGDGGALYCFGPRAKCCWLFPANSVKRRWRWAQPNGKRHGDIVLPNASTGIMGSFFLALARALGENNGGDHGDQAIRRASPLRFFRPVIPLHRSLQMNLPKPAATSMSHR